MDSKKLRSANVVLCLLIVFTLVFIWGNSAMSRDASSTVSNTFLQKVNLVLGFIGLTLKDDFMLRKAAHFLEFALLGGEVFLLFYLNISSPHKPFILVGAISFSVAMIDELIQFFSGRHSSFMDVILDFTGAVFGVAVITVLKKHINKSSGSS